MSCGRGSFGVEVADVAASDDALAATFLLSLLFLAAHEAELVNVLVPSFSVCRLAAMLDCSPHARGVREAVVGHAGRKEGVPRRRTA